MKRKKISPLLMMCAALIVLFMVLHSYPAESTQTEIWTTSTFEDFQRGEAEHILLTKTGEMTLAPQLTEMFTLNDNDTLVWAMVVDSKGNLYAGTGEQGRIFKFSPEGEVSLFFDSPEIGILSLAVDAEDNIYAGSAPDGFIYKIAPDGTQTTFFMTEEHYVWSLVFGANNILYAGTGESGKIYKIMPDGTGSVLYDSPQSHIMALLYDPQGCLYAGTEGQGITYNVAQDGSAFALYQAKEEEIHSLALDSKGNLYIAAISNKVYPKPPAVVQAEQQPKPKGKILKKSVIYQISPQGTVSEILNLPETLVYAMIVDQDDNLLVGTDDNGKLYRVMPTGEYHQILNVQAGNILALVRNAGDHLYAGTGDAGAVYRIDPQHVTQGQYLSAIHDATTTATWGKIFWRGTNQHLSLFTRTGNTKTPDDTWSPWSGDLQNKEGETIPNPSARFIQWKAVLASQEQQQSPMLEEVSVAYLPHNLAPKVEQVLIYYAAQQALEDQKNSSSREFVSQTNSSRSSQEEVRNQKNGPKPPKYIPSGYIAIVWSAKDPNTEDLLYSIALSGGQDTPWKILEEEFESPRYMLDTTTLPDGSYYVKVTATDKANNPPDKALTGEKVSERFDIDNTAPQISIALNQKQSNNGEQVIVIAHDDFSRLNDAQYAIDAGEWTAIFPDDQVSDSRDEKYTVILSDLAPGPHVLTFKATDLFGNVGAGRIQFSTSDAQTVQQ